MRIEPKTPVAVDVTMENIGQIVMDVVNENNDTSTNGARSTAVQKALLEILTEKGSYSGRVVSPADRAKARLAVLVDSAEEISDRLS